MDKMTNEQLIDTLKAASNYEENIALKMLLIMSAERIERLHASLYGTQDE